jgi:thiol-disulfide isomerase/thioredoxin
VKVRNLIWAGEIVCLLAAAFAGAAQDKPFELSVKEWVTQNPPTSEDVSGRVCVVEFWATWCPPCREQIPHMKALVKKYEGRNVVFVGLSEDQSSKEVRKFVEKKKINYHIGMDNGLSDRLGGVNAIPTAFIISHEGKIVWRGNPADSRFEEHLESAVTAMVKANQVNNKNAVAKAN